MKYFLTVLFYIGVTITQETDAIPILKDPYSDGTFLAVRILGALFFTSIGLTCCFAGRDIEGYLIFISTFILFFIIFLMLIGSFVSKLTLTQLIIIGIIAMLLNFILPCLAVYYKKFGRAVLGVLQTTLIWAFLNVLGAFKSSLAQSISSLIFIIIGIVVPFFYPDTTVVVSTTSIGCTYTVAGVDFLAQTGFLKMFANPDNLKDAEISVNIVIMIICSSIIGLLGSYAQYRYRKNRELTITSNEKLVEEIV